MNRRKTAEAALAPWADSGDVAVIDSVLELACSLVDSEELDEEHETVLVHSDSGCDDADLDDYTEHFVVAVMTVSRQVRMLLMSGGCLLQVFVHETAEAAESSRDGVEAVGAVGRRLCCLASSMTP